MTCLKVLLSAYSCRPGMGSEPGVGWNTAKELAKHHQVWVLTRADNRPMIEAEAAKNPIPGLQFVYCDLPGAKLWRRGLQGVQVHLHYYLWQIKAYFIALQLHQEVGLDIAHHVTYVRYSSPSFLSLLPIPFIWGPVGGGESAPAAFWQDFSLRGKVYEVVRRLVHQVGEFDPFTRLTAKRSHLIRATTVDTSKRLLAIGAREVTLASESGLSQNEIDSLAQCPLTDTAPLRFISMARLLHWKGLHLGLKAFAQADLPTDTEYWLLGEGPELERLQTLAKELGITEQVKFWGKLPRHETLNKLSQSHVLVHPSLHDSGGWVCLEAMAASRPVVCLDLGGPAIQVTEKTGFKVAAQTPEQAIADMAEAMTRLAQDPALRMQMGQFGQRHVQEFYSWETKARMLSQIYQESVASKP